MSAAWSGCSVAWLARCTGGAEVASSNLAIPTILFPRFFAYSLQNNFVFPNVQFDSLFRVSGIEWNRKP